MSRIGKKPILIPEKTEVSISEGEICVKGPLGELSRAFRSEEVSITVKDGTVVLASLNDTKTSQALWGTYASHIGNMIKGVNEVYEKKLIIEGVGYKAEVSGDNVVLTVGFSNPVILHIPSGVKTVVEKNVIAVSGIDKESVGQFTAQIRASKKPEPYKGKGIRYENEVIRRKQGKRAAT